MGTLGYLVPFLVDAFIVAIIAAGIFAEARRGFFLALTDILRIVVALVLGFASYSFAHRLFRSYAAGFVAFAVVALTVVFAIRALVWWLGWNPAWGRTVAGRVAGGAVGFVVGCLICASFVPVFGRLPRWQGGIVNSALAQPFLETMPGIYYVADALDLDLPMLNARAIRFEDEGRAGGARLVDRINYSSLDGSMCIECRAAVRFRGYKRRFEIAVSPKLVCPNCGRTSDGCQTFEGFHRMYRRCPVDVARALGPIDCGVWPNDRPVYPSGACPVDGRSIGDRPVDGEAAYAPRRVWPRRTRTAGTAARRLYLRAASVPDGYYYGSGFAENVEYRVRLAVKDGYAAIAVAHCSDPSRLAEARATVDRIRRAGSLEPDVVSGEVGRAIADAASQALASQPHPIH